MNELVKQFGESLQVLAFPCNQFGHQENTADNEILNSLKYVRPGGNYEPLFPISCKIQVNGEGADPLFKFLRHALPFPSDMPHHLISDPKLIIWAPVERNDIMWNFEKFLIGKDGIPFKRFSSKFPTSDLKTDIEHLIKQ